VSVEFGLIPYLELTLTWFPDFIQPICLPKINYKSKVGEILTAAGFGRTLKGNKSPVKLKIQLPVFDQQKCSQKFKTTLDIRITDNQICAGGRKIEDTCDSDSGGPLMYNDGYAWYLEGIVSVGNRCGLEGWPGIYTRVSNYVNWIHSKLR
jgi:serine protease 7